jgi:HTH-type transcriptional regulator / antitoxin HigA
MADARREAFEPDYAVPPGETLRETLESIEMSQADLARRADLSAKHVNQIVQGEAAITPETALALERVTGVPARIWNSLEANFQAQRIRISQRRRLDPDDLAWLRRFPAGELVRRQAIEGSNDAHLLFDQILGFFGVANRQRMGEAVALSRSRFPPIGSLSGGRVRGRHVASIGELKAAQVRTDPFDRAAFRFALDEARGLVTGAPDEFFPAMVDLCAQARVALVLVSEVKGAREWSESLDLANQSHHSAIHAVSVGGPLLVLVPSRGRSRLPARQTPRLCRFAGGP